MLQLINLVLDDEMIEQYGEEQGILKLLDETGCDSIEWIWGGRKIEKRLPRNLTKGYHLTFFSDWLDFYRQNHQALKRKFASPETIKSIYGSTESGILLSRYREDLARAISCGAQYVVFHVSDVSIEEGYSYRFEHSDKEVLDASIELINQLLESVDTEIDFLVENLWWAGFRFTELEKTQYLLDNIDYKNKGIMLDTGHLMNTDPSIDSEEEGIDYILDCLKKHGEYSRYIKGIHLNKSLSGEYVRRSIGANAPQGDYFESFMKSYDHILQIDRHEPFDNPKIQSVVEKIRPKYLVHELKGSSIAEKKAAILRQKKALNG